MLAILNCGLAEDRNQNGHKFEPDLQEFSVTNLKDVDSFKTIHGDLPEES